MLKPVYTQHFAERFLARFNGDMKLLKKVKRSIESRYCEHVFHCVLYGAKQRLDVDGVKVCILFDDTKKQLLVTTVY